MRAAEYIESDALFLRLFGPQFLDVLPETGLWDRPQIFRSAPGGGKTSLLRAFTPSVLLALHEASGNDDYKELFGRMRQIEAISDTRPELLGVMLSCDRGYATIEDLGLDPSLKTRLFNALLNSRLILAALRGALVLRKLRFPSDLDRLTVRAPAHFPPSLSPQSSYTGTELYDWAGSVERRACAAMDSFDLSACEAPEGHDGLDALAMIRPDGIFCDNQPVASRVVVMLDDVHKLTTAQRGRLITDLFEVRLPIGVWIAERLEALSPHELLAPGAGTGRDYNRPPIVLEEFWRSNKQFERVVTSIADRRVRSLASVDIGSFASRLPDSLDGASWQTRFEEGIATISARVRRRAVGSKRYDHWIRDKETFAGTPHQRAREWKSLEIIIERDLKKNQREFDFELSSEELHKRGSSGVDAAAEFALRRELKLPYYIGMPGLASSSSSNIEQFVSLASDLFDEILSAAIMKRDPALPPERQEAILRKAAQQRWDELPRRLYNGRDVQRLLGAVSQLAQKEIHKPSASYAPGVTGIAVRMTEREQLLDATNSRRYAKLAKALASCISDNLVEVTLDHLQGQKGRPWMVLYLNRWLCIHFGLPLGYGGWRPVKLDDLCHWLDQGRASPATLGMEPQDS